MSYINDLTSISQTFYNAFMEKLQTFIKERINIELSAAQISAFKAYESLLVKWNEKFNLTSITGSEAIQTKHFIDSLTCLLVMKDTEAVSFIDIGTGAGFPGIPLKIMRPELKLTLVDSSQKKINFCKTVIHVLDLADSDAIAARSEDLGRNTHHREHYDWAAARAVAELPILAEYLLPLVKVGGNVLVMKGSEVNAEISKSLNALTTLGGEVLEKLEVSLPEGHGERTLIVIKKVAPTPDNYPRRAGIPSKKPLI